MGHVFTLSQTSVVQKFQITIKERTKLKSKIQED